MTNRHRFLATAAAIIATAVTAIAPASQMAAAMHRPAAPAPARHTCTAEIIPFEDGSWLGGELRYDGRLIDRRWDARMPRYGWLPGFKGTPCRLVIKH